MASTLPRLPLFEDIFKHDAASTAIVHSESRRTFTYGRLLRDVARGKEKLQEETGKGKSLEGKRIAFLVENGYDYVVTFLAIRAAQAIAVPLSGSFPAYELGYVLNQSKSAVFLSSGKMQEKANEVMREELEIRPTHATLEKITSEATSGGNVSLQDLQGEDKGGMMLYTSGTTSRPKGVLLPGSVLTAQALSLIKAWKYNPSDRLLHVLPLHHIHGTMNALLAPLHAGSSIEFLFPFHPEQVWHRFAAPFLPSSSSTPPSARQTPPSQNWKPITFFTVVPTIYSRLLAAQSSLPPEVQEASRTAISSTHLRLAMSGSAALPAPTRKAWSDLSSSNTLVERYGMTECGMALSCGLWHSDRVPNSVGWPLPSVQVRLVDNEDPSSSSSDKAIIQPGDETTTDGKEKQGEIQLRGPTIFREYFGNPAATASEFVPAAKGDSDQSPWFKTGDIAIRRSVPGAGAGEIPATSSSPDSNPSLSSPSQPWTQGPLYFIQGRASSDILKTGGEKVSALEIERELLSLPQVSECAVVGLPSAKWGQKVAAVVVLSEEGKRAGKNGGYWGKLDMRRALKERLAAYKCPVEMKVVEALERNAMGKVNKKVLVEGLRDRSSPEPEEEERR